MSEDLRNRPPLPLPLHEDASVDETMDFAVPPQPRCRVEADGQEEKSVFMQLLQENPQGMDEDEAEYNARIKKILVKRDSENAGLSQLFRKEMPKQAVTQKNGKGLQFYPQNKLPYKRVMENGYVRKVADRDIWGDNLNILMGGICFVMAIMSVQSFPLLVAGMTLWLGGHAAWSSLWYVAQQLKTPYDTKKQEAEKFANLVLSAKQGGDLDDALTKKHANPSGCEGLLTPLHAAVCTGLPDVARKLLDYGADPDVRAVGNTPLHDAVLGQDIEMAQLLVERGANPNLLDSEGYTPVFRSIKLRNADMVALLRSHGADLDIPDKDGMTARQFLHLVEQKKSVVDVSQDVPERNLGVKPATKRKQASNCLAPKCEP